jgi:hypothetical protein
MSEGVKGLVRSESIEVPLNWDNKPKGERKKKQGH